MSIHPDPKPTPPAEAESKSENDDITFLKSLAEKSKESNNETPVSDSVHDESDSTKNRRLADDYDSTKNGMDYKYQGEKTETLLIKYSQTLALFTISHRIMCSLQQNTREILFPQRNSLLPSNSITDINI